MKAILLAGGQGSRLWPVCAGGAKYMAPLPGGPLLGRTVRELARAGVTDLMITLQAGDCGARDFFRESGTSGLRISFHEEAEPLGTAGAVRACAGFVGDEDFWVVCGDVVWDFDLRPALALHRARSAAATLLLAHSTTPEQFGAAACDRLGRVVYFEEKPPLARCRSVAVNTGITLCSPEIFHALPRSGDLGRDVFPVLLGRGTLWGTAVEGYWRDVGTPSDLLSCGAELLSGKGGDGLASFRHRPGIYSAGPLPEQVEFIPPCWVGWNVRIGPGSLIGPHTVLGDGTVIGRRSLIQCSLLDGAAIGDRATLYGAVLCRNVRSGNNCVMNDGAVVGPGAVLGDGVTLMEGVRVAPEAYIPHGVRLSRREDGKNSLYFLGNV